MMFPDNVTGCVIIPPLRGQASGATGPLLKTYSCLSGGVSSLPGQRDVMGEEEKSWGVRIQTTCDETED